jgi:hypothetical protein
LASVWDKFYIVFGCSLWGTEWYVGTLQTCHTAIGMRVLVREVINITVTINNHAMQIYMNKTPTQLRISASINMYLGFMYCMYICIYVYMYTEKRMNNMPNVCKNIIYIYG